MHEILTIIDIDVWMSLECRIILPKTSIQHINFFFFSLGMWSAQQVHPLLVTLGISARVEVQRSRILDMKMPSSLN